MRFKIQVAHHNTPTETWWEEYVEDIEDAEAWGRETIAFYNRTRRSENDIPRIFVSAEVIDPDEMPVFFDDDWGYLDDEDDLDDDEGLW